MSEAQRGSFTVALASSSIVDVLVIPGLPSLSVEMTLMNCMGQDTPLLALKLGSACGIVARYGVLKFWSSLRFEVQAPKPAFERI
jgi:hypothetical protein